MRIERIYLDAAPLAAELKAREGHQRKISRKSGVSERAIFRYTSGVSRHVRIDIADKLALAMGIPLALLYDFDVEPLHDVAHQGSAA